MTALCIASVLVLAFHVLQARIGLNLSDEGFLWNGTLRIGEGKVPIRDYKCYDPGRYLWCYAWTAVLGRGILGIRRATALFQVFGIWAGVLVVSRIYEELWLQVFAGLLMVWWMQPRHKRFDHAVALIAVYVVVRLLESPGSAEIFSAGVFVGFAAFMGRNHGVYTILSVSGILLYLLVVGQIDDWPRAGLLAVGGVFVGYAPMWSMWLFIPGMFARYLDDKVLVFIRRGSANMPKSIPWPWKVSTPGLSWRQRVSAWILGAHFGILPLIYAVATLRLATVEFDAVLAASLAVGVPYLHHAFTRPDAEHLCQSAPPYLICALALIAATSSAPLQVLSLGLLAITGFFAVRSISPLLQWIESRKNFEAFDAAGDRLLIPTALSRRLTNIRNFVEANISPEEAMFIGPVSATLYPLLGKRVPVHSDYMLFPDRDEKQQETIGDLERNQVSWAFIHDYAMDGNENLRFRNAHPAVWAYIGAAFEEVAAPGIPSDRTFYRRKADPEKWTSPRQETSE